MTRVTNRQLLPKIHPWLESVWPEYGWCKGSRVLIFSIYDERVFTNLKMVFFGIIFRDHYCVTNQSKWLVHQNKWQYKPHKLYWRMTVDWLKSCRKSLLFCIVMIYSVHKYNTIYSKNFCAHVAVIVSLLIACIVN